MAAVTPLMPAPTTITLSIKSEDCRAAMLAAISFERRRKSPPYNLKLKNNFAAAFSLRGVSYCRFCFADRISSFHFRFQQAALCHFKEWPKRFHAFGHGRVIVPLVNPNPTETKIFEYEQPVWNFQRLQTHRAKCDDRRSGR